MPPGSAPHQSSAPDPKSVLAELRVITDTLERHRERVTALADPFFGTERDDCVTALHEAERSLLMTTRTLQRAIRTLEH